MSFWFSPPSSCKRPPGSFLLLTPFLYHNIGGGRKRGGGAKDIVLGHCLTMMDWVAQTWNDLQEEDDGLWKSNGTFVFTVDISKRNCERITARQWSGTTQPKITEDPSLATYTCIIDYNTAINVTRRDGSVAHMVVATYKLKAPHYTSKSMSVSTDILVEDTYFSWKDIEVGLRLGPIRITKQHIELENDRVTFTLHFATIPYSKASYNELIA